ncbi:Sec-independent protein translocase protein TatB [Xanthomonas arboricola]|uniref:Sec-independent protein translocase protein TatB n=1 Tax=Xanthomonas arboricola TaxID=56448 RepID=UPI000CEEDD0E|nr:Sec-independent protein translocase protein TatB [Xanthomonas arboricola]PPU38978.1 twin-arginine translocase subunit TatB [Xanthomonas arboricola pv. populi]
MFDIGVGELTLIAIVALVVLGPERLPKAARFAGLWVRRARMQWDSVKQELERELEAEELKRSLQDVQASLREAEDQLRNKQQHLEQGARALHHEVGRDIDIRSSAAPVATPLELAHADLSAGANAASAAGAADAPEHAAAASVIAQAQPIAPAPHQTLVPAPHDPVVPAPHAAHLTSTSAHAQTPVTTTPMEPSTLKAPTEPTEPTEPGKIQGTQP